MKSGIQKIVEWLNSDEVQSEERYAVLWHKLCEKVLAFATEEKSGDEGLREELERYALRFKNSNTCMGRLSVIWDDLSAILSRHPSPKEAPAELLTELESLAGEDNAYYMHINGQKKTGVSYVCRKSLQEIISRYRPAPDRTGELVKRLKYEADLYAEMPTSTMDTAEYERTKGIAQGLYKAAEIVRDFEGGA